VVADRLNNSGEVGAPNARSGRGKPKAQDAHQVGRSRDQVHVTNVNTRCANVNEHIVIR